MAISLDNYLATRMLGAGPARSPYAGIAGFLQSAFDRFNARQDAAATAQQAQLDALERQRQEYGFKQDIAKLSVPEDGDMQLVSPAAVGLPATWQPGFTQDNKQFNYYKPMQYSRTGAIRLIPQIQQVGNPWNQAQADLLAVPQAGTAVSGFRPPTAFGGASAMPTDRDLLPSEAAHLQRLRGTIE